MRTKQNEKCTKVSTLKLCSSTPGACMCMCMCVYAYMCVHELTSRVHFLASHALLGFYSRRVYVCVCVHVCVQVYMCVCLLTSSAWLCISSSSHAHSHSRTGCATCVIYVHIYFYCRALLSGCKGFLWRRSPHCFNEALVLKIFSKPKEFLKNEGKRKQKPQDKSKRKPGSGVYKRGV